MARADQMWLASLDEARAAVGRGPTASEQESSQEPELLGDVNNIRAELGLEPLTADGWNPVKQWRAPKGEEGAGRFIEMPDVKAKLKPKKGRKRASTRPAEPTPATSRARSEVPAVPAAPVRTPPAGVQQYELTQRDLSDEAEWLNEALSADEKGWGSQWGDGSSYKALVARRLEGRMRDLPAEDMLAAAVAYQEWGQYTRVRRVKATNEEPEFWTTSTIEGGKATDDNDVEPPRSPMGTEGLHYGLHPETGELIEVEGWDGKSQFQLRYTGNPNEVLQSKDLVAGGTPEVEHLIRQWSVSGLVGAWAGTSNDEHAGSITTQEAIREQFGLTEAMDWRGGTEPFPLDGNIGKVINRFVNAMHAETQDMFRRHGITEVVLYRGSRADTDEELADMITDPEAFLELQERVTKGNLPLEMPGTALTRPGSSWATSEKVGQEFAKTAYKGGKHGIMTRAVIPVEDILATPVTGVGAANEWEMVPLGRPREAQIAPWGHEGRWYGDAFPEPELPEEEEEEEYDWDQEYDDEFDKDEELADIKLDTNDTNADWIKQVGDTYEQEHGEPYQPKDAAQSPPRARSEAAPTAPAARAETKPSTGEWKAKFDAAKEDVPHPDDFGRDDEGRPSIAFGKDMDGFAIRVPSDKAKADMEKGMKVAAILTDELEARTGHLREAMESKQAELRKVLVPAKEAYEKATAKRDEVEKLRKPKVDAVLEEYGYGTEASVLANLAKGGPARDHAMDPWNEIGEINAELGWDQIVKDWKAASPPYKEAQADYDAQMAPLQQAFREAQARESISILREARDFGGEQDFNVNDNPDEITNDPEQDGAFTAEEATEVWKAMDRAAEMFPAEWNEMLKENLQDEGQEYEIRKGSRGYQMRNADGATIVLSPDKNPAIAGDGPYDAVAVHELAHAMEQINSAIRIAQWIYSHQRAPRDQEEKEVIYDREDQWGNYEEGHRDKWAEHYSGKVYKDDPDTQWELFTMAIEALFNGTGSFERFIEQGGFDHDQRTFLFMLLGLL